MELYGVRIPTIITENVSIRCAGCGGIIQGTPWRVSILDIVAPESAPSWAEHATINPGPFQFHPDADHVLQWMAQRRTLFCRRSAVRELMRPVWLPAGLAVEERRMGLCDGMHRDDHEFVEPESRIGFAQPDAAAATAQEARAATAPEVEAGIAEPSTAQESPAAKP